MLNALLKRKRQNHLLDLWPFGVLATLTANQMRGKDSRMTEPWDLFPELIEMREGGPVEQAKTPDELLDIVSAINAALGGKDLRRNRQLVTIAG